MGTMEIISEKLKEVYAWIEGQSQKKNVFAFFHPIPDIYDIILVNSQIYLFPQDSTRLGSDIGIVYI